MRRMMLRSILYYLAAASMMGCATAPDPIDNLVTQLSASEDWFNGIYPEVSLPKTASIKQVLIKVFPMAGVDSGHLTKYEILESVTSYKILKIRQVYIQPAPGNVPPESYIAVLVQTNLGEKIVLLKYGGDIPDWWSRVYDANTSN